MLLAQMLGGIYVTNIGIGTHDSLIFYLKHKSRLDKPLALPSQAQ
jgi:hypothetical protein